MTLRQLSGQDAMFLYLDNPRASAHGTLIYIYDQSTAPKGLVRFKQILRHIEANLDLAPFFRKKLMRVPLELDYPYLVDDHEFDLNYHVRHIALPKPGDWRQFCIQAARINARPLDLSRPLWEMYVVEGLDNIGWLPKGCFAILTKLHHAVVDGTALSELTWRLHSQQPVVPRRKPKRWTPKPAPEMMSLLTRAAVNTAVESLRAGKALASVGPKLGLLAGKLAADAAMGRHKVPRTRFNARVAKERVFDGAEFAFEDVRAIKTAVAGATVNDTVAAVIGGALRRYLADKRESVAPTLVALMPINTRQDSAERATQGNTVSVMTSALRTDIADPLARLAAIHGATSRSKEVAKAIGARELTDLTKHTPAPTMMLASKLLLAGSFGGDPRLPFYNCCISNVPGPQDPLYLLGARLEFFSVVAPLTDGLTMFFAVSSYNGKLMITITSTPEIVPDPAFMVECMRESFAELKSAAGKASAPRPRPGVKRSPRRRESRPQLRSLG